MDPPGSESHSTMSNVTRKLRSSHAEDKRRAREDVESRLSATVRRCARSGRRPTGPTSGMVGTRERGGGGVIQSVDRALRILTVLQGARHRSLGEIAARLDLPP